MYVAMKEHFFKVLSELQENPEDMFICYWIINNEHPFERVKKGMLISAMSL